jgi:STE20-like kinase
MLIEYCDGGALDSIMVELEKPLTELQIAYVCQHMVRGLTFLHSTKVIHRDLKAGNVLLTMEGGVKLGELVAIQHSRRNVVPIYSLLNNAE